MDKPFSELTFFYIFTVTSNLKDELKQYKKMCDEMSQEKEIFTNKFILLQEDKNKFEVEINTLVKEIETLKEKLLISKENLIAKDNCILQISKENDAVISVISKELLDEKTAKENMQQELEKKSILVYELQQNLEELNYDKEALNIMKKENEELMKAVQERETCKYLDVNFCKTFLKSFLKVLTRLLRSSVDFKEI